MNMWWIWRFQEWICTGQTGNRKYKRSVNKSSDGGTTWLRSGVYTRAQYHSLLKSCIARTLKVEASVQNESLKSLLESLDWQKQFITIYNSLTLPLVLHNVISEDGTQCSISKGMSISCKVSTLSIPMNVLLAGWCQDTSAQLAKNVLAIAKRRTCINAFRRSVPRQSSYAINGMNATDKSVPSKTYFKEMPTICSSPQIEHIFVQAASQLIRKPPRVLVAASNLEWKNMRPYNCQTVFQLPYIYIYIYCNLAH